MMHAEVKTTSRSMCCGEGAPGFEKVPFLICGMEETGTRQSITALLDRFKSETVFEAKCSSCGAWTERREKRSFTDAPKILMIQAKRFRYASTGVGGTVIQGGLSVEESLRWEDEQAGQTSHYRLRSCVVYWGDRPTGGHYVCLARDGEGWCVADDSRVMPLSTQQAMDHAAGSYLLFYTKVGD